MDRSLHRRGAANATGSFSSACCGPAGCGPPLRLVPDEGGGFCGADRRPCQSGEHQFQCEGRPRRGPGQGEGRPALLRALQSSFESTFRCPQPWRQGWRNNNKTTFA